MIGRVLLYIGSVIIAGWGISHLAATKSILNDFGELSPDNRRILTMSWINEGVAMVFIGILVFLTALTGQGTALARLVIRLSTVALLALAVISGQTGAKTSILPMQMCPYIKSGVGLLFVLGSVLG